MTSHRYAALPFDCTRIGPAEQRMAISLSDGHRSIELDLGTGESRERSGSFAPRAQRFQSASEASLQGHSCYADVIVERDAQRACALIVHNQRERLSLAVDSTAALYTDETLCVCTTKTSAHFVAIRDGSLASVTVALPFAEARDVDVRGEFAWILAGQTLLGVDVDTLAFDSINACASLEYEAIAPANARDPRPAVATMVLAGKLLLDHPGFGRLTLDRKASDPPVSKGDRIALDEVVEEHPRLFRVRKWSRWTHEREATPAATLPRLVLEAPPSALLTDR